jgi:catechol 2,3-dioxygenase-like lactoylglutathione lyase family enzyme
MKGFAMAAVRYLVTDVEKSIEFYCNKLGFTLEDQWGSAFAIVSKGNLKLWLSGPETSAARPIPDGRKPVPGGWNRIIVVVLDLDSSVTGLKQDGVLFRSEIISGPGGRHILMEDPSGNPVELFERRKNDS